jgi:hypothetical protein
MDLGRVAKSGTRRWEVKRAELVGPPECPVMQRWCLLTPLLSIRLHHFLRPDEHRHPHDHPWWFITLVLKGGYVDRAMINGIEHADTLKRFSIRFRPALHRHWVDTQDSWTLILTGPVSRKWGFWIGNNLFEPVADYFKYYGYAPCDDN